MIEQDRNLLSGKGEWNEEDHPRDEKGQFVSKGEQKTMPIKSTFAKNSKLIDNTNSTMISYKEKAALYSAIRTRYGNKIPPNSYYLYGDYFYIFNYDRESENISLTFKVPIVGNEKLINKMRRWFDE